MCTISRMKGVSFRSSFSPPLLWTTETWSRVSAKVLLILLGFCLWGVAVAFLFGGAFVILTYKSYIVFFQNSFFSLPGCLALVIASLLFLTGALAIFTPGKNSRHHQGTLMYLLMVLFCLEASSAVMTQVYSTQVAYQLTSSVHSLFHGYNRPVPNYPSNEAVDAIQQQLECCGIYNYTDWFVLALPSQLQRGPKSCCKEVASDCTDNASLPETLFEEGCLSKLEKRVHFVRHYMNWCCVIGGCLEMLTVISNGVLMKQQPFQDFRILDSANFS
ncbi:tetraspanin-3-like [Sphaerodactylus townsendi]|uniref:tetraspanin-3-like n=1 Tax=Sphaerodactylus townsendi TaxID=933632 RepID=UPI002025CB61|nr:tetraspanin-3-like [Sphaerodactylus townsendi]